MAWAASVVEDLGAEAAAWLGEDVVDEAAGVLALPLRHAAQHAARQIAVAPAEAANVGAAAEGGGGGAGEAGLLERIDKLLVRPTPYPYPNPTQP